MGKAIVIAGIDASGVGLGKVNLVDPSQAVILPIVWVTNNGVNSQLAAAADVAFNILIGADVNALSERYAGVIDVSAYNGKTIEVYAASNVSSTATEKSNGFTKKKISDIPVPLSESYPFNTSDAFNSLLFNTSETDGQMASCTVTVPSGANTLLITHKVAASGHAKSDCYVKVIG